MAFAGGPPAVTESAPGVWQVAPAAVTVRDDNESSGQMREGTGVFLVVRGGRNSATGGDHHVVNGTLSGSDEDGWTVSFQPLELDARPEIARDGVYFAFKGATLTAKAFDRVLPGLGYWVVPATVFLFAFST